MAYIAGRDRTQVVLLPEVLDDYVTADNPVRFLDAFVAQLDLGTLSFQRSVPADTGRPGYDPGDLLRLYLYGYLPPHSLQPAAGAGDASQHRADVVGTRTATRLQDHR